MTPDPSSRHAVDLTLCYDDDREARIVERSIAREVGEIDDDRSHTSVERDGRDVRLAIEAADHVALRAAINTWCSLVDVAERTVAIANDRRSNG